MGSFLSSSKPLAEYGQKRKQDHALSCDNSSPTKKRIRSTYEYIYQEFFCKGENSDITVTALDRDWALHRAYIKQSPFFAAMFDGGWRESACCHIDLQLSDENITSQALHVVFGSFYRDWVPLTDQTALGILAAATWFHLDDIRQLCSDFLRRNIKLETIIEFHTIANKYNLPELHKTCVNWLSQKLLVLPDSMALFSLLKQIPVTLMQPVVNHPKLVVIQLEQDVFICLLKWLYLQQNPDANYSNATKLLKDAYQYFTTTKSVFLESPEGEPYVAVFRSIRWQHVVSLYKATRRLVKDNIVPRAWLLEAFEQQWMQLLNSHESYCLSQSGNAATTARSSAILPPGFTSSAASSSSTRIDIPGPSDELPDALFWRRSERFGRRMTAPEHTCSWRWTGFHFGVDVLIKYKRRVFHVIRITDTSAAEGAVSCARQHRLKVCLTLLSSPNENGDVDDNSHPRPTYTSTASDAMTPTTPATSDADTADFSDAFESDIGDGETGACLDWSDDWETSSRPSESDRFCCSGLKTFTMGENTTHELLRIPDNFVFPAIVSVNILRYNPITMP